MSQFEFAGIVVSIFVALALSRVVDALPAAIQRPGRYWVHVGWLSHKFLSLLFWWWGSWANRDVVISFPAFLAILATPMIYSVQVRALIQRSQSNPASWETRFFEIRRWFFAGNIAIVGLVLITARLAAATGSLPDGIATPLLTIAGLSACGMLTENRHVHTVLVVAHLLILTVGVGRTYL